MASSVKVLQAPHTGITVRSLERATHLFHNILNLPVQRTARLSPPISTIVGHPQVEIGIAIIELPGGHCIELLEYALPAEERQKEMKPMSWELGSWHLCLTVESLDETVRALAECDSSWAPMAAPQRLEKGPNAGKRLVYMRNQGDGMILELFE
ncbi:hypothetical protein RBB50_011822 [Rhinocladiella similis]